MKHICKVCGKEFSQWRKGRIPQTCSRECRIKSKDKTISCAQCGGIFRVSLGQDRKFCSQKCSNQYNQQPDPDKKAVFICQFCHGEFTEWAYRNPKFCSSTCKNKYAGRKRGEQLYKPDSVKTRGFNWKSQAALARKRDNYTCKACGKHGWVHRFRVQVHHIIPYRLFNGDYESANDLSNLVSLCPSCHPRVESGTIKLNP